MRFCDFFSNRCWKFQLSVLKSCPNFQWRFWLNPLKNLGLISTTFIPPYSSHLNLKCVTIKVERVTFLKKYSNLFHSCKLLNCCETNIPQNFVMQVWIITSNSDGKLLESFAFIWSLLTNNPPPFNQNHFTKDNLALEL